MRAVIQRVKRARVLINGEVRSAIEGGLLVLLGMEDRDGVEDMSWLSNKLIHLPSVIFNDPDGVMNLSLAETQGGLLLVSQFTLLAAAKKGN